MQYEKYELKIQRIEKLFKFILKHLGKAIVLCSLIVATTGGLLVAKGTVTTKGNTLPMEVYYGETFQYEAKAFMSDVEYEYAPLGSDAWSKDVPLVPGEYQVRAVAKATFGYRYGDPEAFTIKKKPMMVSISDSGVHYGAEPSVSTTDLVYADRLAGATFTYNADHSHAEIASVLIHDEYGTDITSRYEISTTGRDIYTTRRPVTIAIEDAVKIYDGTPLTSDRYALTAGSLASGDRLEVTFDTSLTDVGRVQSEATYKITNAAGEETTQLYEITETLGYLEVLAREVSIKTGSLTVTYDAKPHSNKGFEPLSELSLVEGHTLSVDAWAEITNVGSVVNAFSEYQILDAAGNDVTKNYVLAKDFGILTVNKKVVTLSTPNAGKVYDGTPLSTDTYLPSNENVVGIVDGHSWTVSGYQSIVNAGTVDNTLSLAITDGAGNDVSPNYEIAGTWGTLTVTQRPLTVTTGGYTGIYDGKNHANELTNTLGAGGNTTLADGHSFAEVKPLGSVQNVSDKTSAMSFTIVDASGAPVTGNYRITPEWGTVTISPRPITVKTASGSKIYDGKPLTKQEWEIVDPDDAAFLTELGHTVDGSNITGSATNVLIGENGAFLSVPNTYNADAQRVVKDANGVPVSENYAVAISEELGTLAVEPSVITIVTDSATKNYDGTPLEKKAWKVTSGTLLPGHTVDPSMITGSATDVYYDANGALGAVVNTYDPTKPILVLQGTTDVSSNYTIVVDDTNLGTLTIKKRVVVCSPNGASQTYNGMPLSNNGYDFVGDIRFLDTHSVTAAGQSITEVGSRPNNLTFTVTETVGGKDVTGNYDIRQTSVGMLTVEPRIITITTDTRTWVYDAREHDAYEPDAALNPILGYTLGGEGLVGNHVIEVPTLIAKLTNAGTATNAWADGALVRIFDGRKDVTHNYKIEANFGTLTVTKRPISVGTWTYNATYDGIDHTPDAENVMFTLEGSLSLCDGHWFKTGTKPTIKNVTSEPNQYDYAIYDDRGDVTANYEIIGGEPEWGTITVTPKPITVTPVHIGDFTYDGIDRSYLNGLTVTEGELVAYHEIVILADTNEPLLNAGTYSNRFDFQIMDTRTGETVSKANYDYGTIAWETVVIHPIRITITQNDIQDFTYDGTDHGAESYLIATGLPEQYALKVDESTRAELINAGEYTIKLGYTFCDKEGNPVTLDPINYQITDERNGDSVTIYRKQITMIASGVEDFIYDGTDHASLGKLNAVGLVEGHELDSIKPSKQIINVSSDAYENVMTFKIIDANGDAVDLNNYYIDNEDTALTEQIEWQRVTVSPRKITVTATDIADFIFDGSDHASYGDLIATGLASGHALVVTDHLTTLIDAGTYDEVELAFEIVDANGKTIDQANYYINTPGASLEEEIVWDSVTISPLVITIKPNDVADFTYDGKNHWDKIELEADGLPTQYKIEWDDGDLCNAGIYKNVVNYYFVENGKRVDLKNDSNYVIVEMPWDIVTVLPRAITITPTLKGSFTYDGTDHGADDEKNTLTSPELAALGHKFEILGHTELINADTYTNVLTFRIVDEKGDPVDPTNYFYGDIKWETITVKKAKLTFTVVGAPAASVTYNGTDHAADLGLTVKGPDGYTYTCEVIKESRVPMIHVGIYMTELQYKVFLDGKEITLDHANYDYEEPAWTTVTILPKSITITPTHVEGFTYDGSDHSGESGLTAELVDGHKFEIVKRTELRNAGTYTNVLVFRIVDEDGNEIDLANYSYAPIAWETVTIAKKTLTLTVVNAPEANVTYNGNDYAADLDLSLEDLNGEYTCEVIEASRVPMLNVGTYTTKLQYRILYNGEEITLDHNNFEYTDPEWTTVTISPKQIVITQGEVPDFIYDGTDHSIHDNNTLTATGLVGGHTLKYEIVTALLNAGTHTNVLNFRIEDAQGNRIDLSNYYINDPNIPLAEQIVWDTVTISQKKLTFTLTVDETLEYNGLDQSDNVTLTMTDPDGMGYTLEILERPELKSAGEYSDYRLKYVIRDADGNEIVLDHSNFEYTDPEWKTITISKKSITVTPEPPGELIYDGTDQSSKVDLSHTALADDHELVITGYPVKLIEAGEYKNFVVNFIIRDTITGEDVTENYDYGTIAWQTVTVRKKSITVTPEIPEELLYDGTDQSSKVGLSHTALADDHELVITGYPVKLIETGEYDGFVVNFIIRDTITGEDVTENYDCTVTWETVTVEKKKITVTLSMPAEDLVYDGTDQSNKISLSFQGILDVHELVITKRPEILAAGTYEKESYVWSYDIRIKGTETSVKSNYECNEAGEWLPIEVEKRDLTFTPINPGDFTYDGTDHSYMTGLTVDNLPSQYELVILKKPTLKNASAWDEEKQQYVAITNNVEWEIRDRVTGEPISLDDGNYTVYSIVDGAPELGSPVWKPVTILPKSITVSSAGYVFEYDGEDHADDDWWNVLSGDLCTGHSFTIKKKTALCNVSRNAEGEVVSIDNEMEFYIVDAEGKDVSANYKITEEWGKVTITPRVIKIKTGTQRWLYEEGAAYSCMDYTSLYGDVVAGHQLFVVKETVPTISDYGWVENTLAFGVRLEDLTDLSANYDIQVEYGKLIIPQPIAVYMPSQKVEYDGTSKRIETYNAELLTALDTNLQIKLIGIDVTQKNVGSINSKDLSGLDAPVRFYVYDTETDEYVTDLYYIVVQDRETQENYNVLTVTPRILIIKVGNSTRPYNGKELVHKEYDIYSGSLAVGHSFDPNNVELISGSITEVGVTKNEIPSGAQQSFQILDDATGESVTENYTIKFLSGTLTVTTPD